VHLLRFMSGVMRELLASFHQIERHDALSTIERLEPKSIVSKATIGSTSCTPRWNETRPGARPNEEQGTPPKSTDSVAVRQRAATPPPRVRAANRNPNRHTDKNGAHSWLRIILRTSRGPRRERRGRRFPVCGADELRHHAKHACRCEKQPTIPKDPMRMTLNLASPRSGIDCESVQELRRNLRC